jgi:hypothetical protein
MRATDRELELLIDSFRAVANKGIRLNSEDPGLQKVIARNQMMADTFQELLEFRKKDSSL